MTRKRRKRFRDAVKPGMRTSRKRMAAAFQPQSRVSWKTVKKESCPMGSVQASGHPRCVETEPGRRQRPGCEGGTDLETREKEFWGRRGM